MTNFIVYMIGMLLLAGKPATRLWRGPRGHQSPLDRRRRARAARPWRDGRDRQDSPARSRELIGAGLSAIVGLELSEDLVQLRLVRLDEGDVLRQDVGRQLFDRAGLFHAVREHRVEEREREQ